jgi:hypothetical protein
MKHELRDGEKVEGDSGYVGEPQFICAPGMAQSNYDVYQKLVVRCKHETASSWLKFFKSLSTEFHLVSEKHNKVFQSVAVIVQMNIEHGEEFYDTDYDVNYD